MHETLCSEVKGYIDENTVFNNTVYIKGWTFNQRLGTCPLRVKYNSIYSHVTVEERKDVANFYNRSDITMSGFKFNYPKNTSAELQMDIDGDWVTFFKFTSKNAEPSSVIIIDDTEENKVISIDTTKEIFTKEISSNKISSNKISTKDQIIDLNTEEMLHKLVHKNKINIRSTLNPPTFVVVDNFYEDPDYIRKFALSLTFNEHTAYHKGKRTDECYRFPDLKESFEKIINCKITNWEKYGTNGCFQTCIAGDQLVYHTDGQEYAGVLFLTPDAPPNTGTSFYRSKYTKKMYASDSDFSTVFKNGFLDSTEFDLVDTVGNVYNRLVLFDAKLIHAATCYFGNSLENGRLFQLFFFDIKK
jgi:hypothetical protein